MTRLLWDQIGHRLYEAGIDRGVLYLEDTTGVSWNGLTSVEEDTSEETSEPIYFDGMKQLDEQAYGDFTATLKALTYPDEFLEYEGLASLGGGLYVDDQDSKLFGLSYRTLVGNDLEGTDFGYRLHLVYNLTAVPDSNSFGTVTATTDLTEFSWKLTSVPVLIEGYRPTAHVILDSRFLPSDILETIENILYGGDGELIGDIIYDGGSSEESGPDMIDGGDAESDGEELPGTEVISTGVPRLPSIEELFNIVLLWGPRLIIPDTDTGLASLIVGVGDITQVSVAGIYIALPTTRLAETDVDGFYQLTT